jgi:hypothetical protein
VPRSRGSPRAQRGQGICHLGTAYPAVARTDVPSYDPSRFRHRDLLPASSRVSYERFSRLLFAGGSRVGKSIRSMPGSGDPPFRPYRNTRERIVRKPWLVATGKVRQKSHFARKDENLPQIARFCKLLTRYAFADTVDSSTNSPIVKKTNFITSNGL